MGRKYRSGRGPDEVMLMPAGPRDWLPAGHLAWKVLELARETGLSLFGGFRPDGQGGRPYDPVMMATLLLYCYCRGRRSAREVEMATFDDVGARVICGGLHPGHATVARFVRRNVAAVLGLLPGSVRACAAEGLVSLAVVAGDGTKLKASASMAGSLTRGQLQAQVAELGALAGADLARWAQAILDDDDDGTAAPGDGDRPGPGDDGGPGDGDGARRKWKARPPRAEQMIASRLEALARLDARRDGEGRTRERPDARAAELAARVARKEQALARWEAEALARAARRAAAAAAGHRLRGRAPRPPQDDRQVTRARAALADARVLLAAAPGGRKPPPRPDGKPRPGRAPKPEGGNPGHASPDEARPEKSRKQKEKEKPREPRASPADPSSRVMPLKKGGYDQLTSAQALATAKTQVILAVTRHDSPGDMHAMLPLLQEARRVLAAAGITGTIGSALFDAGYACHANFTAPVPETLYIAAGRDAAQDGSPQHGTAPGAVLPSWQAMKDRLATEDGKQLYKQRSATIEPVFAQLTNRLGRTLHYAGDLTDAELALWAASHNALKAISARTSRLARQARAALTTQAATPATA